MTFEEHLNELIDKFLQGSSCGPCGTNRIITFYSNLTILEAITCACDRGKIKVNDQWVEDPHYKKLDGQALTEAERKLFNVESKLKQANDFLQVYSIVRKVTEDIKGLNRMFWYDTSLRIAAAIGEHCLPTQVFYQHGAEVGALKLGILRKPDEEKPWLPYERFLRVSQSFNRIKPYEIEDFLCIFHSKLDFAKL